MDSSLVPIHRLHTPQNKKRATLPFHCELSAFCEIDFPGAEEREGRHAVQHFGNPENWNTKGQKSLPEFMFGKIARSQKHQRSPLDLSGTPSTVTMRSRPALRNDGWEQS